MEQHWNHGDSAPECGIRCHYAHLSLDLSFHFTVTVIEERIRVLDRPSGRCRRSYLHCFGLCASSRSYVSTCAFSHNIREQAGFHSYMAGLSFVVRNPPRSPTLLVEYLLNRSTAVTQEVECFRATHLTERVCYPNRYCRHRSSIYFYVNRDLQMVSQSFCFRIS